MLLVAQAVGAYSIASIAIAIIVILAVVAIGSVVVQQMGIAIPPVVIRIFWIVFACVLGIIAIRFVMSL